MLDAHAAWLANQGMNYLATGENPPRLGNRQAKIVPYQVFVTADDFVVLPICNDPIRWARRKFKRLRRKTKGARDWFHRLPRANPTLFAHWQLCHGNGRTSGAV